MIVFLVEAKYLFLVFLIMIVLFMALNYLLSIPGNKRIETMAVRDREKAEKRKAIKLIIKIATIIFTCLILIALITNMAFF